MELFNHKSLAFFFGFILFVKLFLDLDFLLTEVSYGDCSETDGWKLIQWITFLSLISLAAGVYLAFKKSKIGWFLLLIFSIYAIINLLRMSLESWRYIHNSRTFDFPAIPVFDPFSTLISSLLFGVLIVGLCQKGVREEFKISENSMVLSVMSISIFFGWLFSFY